mgnify:CR=1 FL=1|jgi:hypothetical protein
MKTQHPKQPPTHKIDFLLYRKTERGIFRLNSAGEWVRSTIDPDDFRRQAKKLTEKEIYPTPPPPPKKTKIFHKARTRNRLKRIEQIKNAIQKELQKTGKIPNYNHTKKITQCGKPLYKKALLMLTQNITADDAVIIYEQNNRAA